MNTKMKAALASYARSFIVASVAVYSTGETSLKAMALAGLVAVVGPAIRAINAKDPAFGFIADTATAELNKLLKADKKKSAKKKA
jgi:hypothetical protein